MSIIGISRTERDASRVIVPATGEPFGMVLQVPYGPLEPTTINTEDDLMLYFAPSGKPDPDYKDYYEAIALLKQTPILACRPQGDATYGGIEIYDSTTGNTNAGLSSGISDPNSYVFADNEVQFVLIGANPSADNNNYSVKIAETTSAVSNTFNIELYYNSTLTETFNVSLLKTQLDGFGNSVYIEEVLKNRKDIKVIVNSSADLTVLPAYDSSAVSFANGSTISSFSDTSYTITAWNYFKEYNKYFTHYLVDCSCNATIGKAVLDIAEENFYQFVFAGAPSIKSSNANSTETLSTWLTTTREYRSVSGNELNVNNDHIGLHANWRRVSDEYNNTTIWISAVSAFAARKAYTINNISISQAAVGPNKNRGVINDAIELEQDPSSVYTTLEDEQINTLVYSPAGITCWGEITMQVAFSNLSFVSHRTYFFYLEENIESNLFFYTFTDINEDTREELASLIRSFTDSQIGIHAEDIQVRVPEDADLAAQKKLKVQVAVIPYPKANRILFEFIHSRSGVDLTEIF